MVRLKQRARRRPLPPHGKVAGGCSRLRDSFFRTSEPRPWEIGRGPVFCPSAKAIRTGLRSGSAFRGVLTMDAMGERKIAGRGGRGGGGLAQDLPARYRAAASPDGNLRGTKSVSDCFEVLDQSRAH